MRVRIRYDCGLWADGGVCGTCFRVGKYAGAGLGQYKWVAGRYDYHYRLSATNENGTNTTIDGEFKTSGQEIDGESMANVTASSATFTALIDPNHAETHVDFEYGPSGSYGSDAPAAESVVLVGAGEREVRVHAQGLQPGTVYHYRVVASSEYYISEGRDQTFTTQAARGSLQLPDGRQWEMVSPPEKDGAAIEPINEMGVTEASTDGNGISYLATRPTEEEPRGYATFVQVLASRGAGGWSSVDLTTHHNHAVGASVGQGYEYRAFFRI